MGKINKGEGNREQRREEEENEEENVEEVTVLQRLQENKPTSKLNQDKVERSKLRETTEQRKVFQRNGRTKNINKMQGKNSEFRRTVSKKIRIEGTPF